MLRSPTHLVGHGPTSHTSSATSSPNIGGGGGGGNSHHHHHNGVVVGGINSPLHRNSHQTNGTAAAATNTTTATKSTTRTTNGFKNGFLLNGGAISGKSQHNNNNNHTSNNNNHHMTSPAASVNSSASSLSTTGGGTTANHRHDVNGGGGGGATPTSTTTQTTTRTSLFDSCHRKIRLIGGGPVAFLGGLVAKARRKERDGDQNASDTKLYLEESVLERKLPEADLKALVDLPAGLDYNEWLASHTLALFEHVNLVYGTISEFCTPSGCPDMTGPGNRTYLWFDEKGKKTRVAAPQYIDYVMTFTQKTVSDELIFPTKYANEFPNSFESIARKILRLQFHVIAHLYAAHFREIALLGLHTHLNLTFAHLTALHRRFNLIDEKETDVLRDLEVALRLTDDGSNSSDTASIQTGSSSVTGISTTNNTAIGSHNNSQHTGAAVTSMTGTVTGASEDVNLLQSGRLIDGDARAQPICTQPEAKKGLNSEQSDIRGGAGGGGGGLMGGILGDFNTSEFGDMRTGGGTSGYCIGGVGLSSTAKSSHIGYNNNHHNGSTHNMLQCNSSSNNSSNNSPTPQQHHHTSHTTTA